MLTKKLEKASRIPPPPPPTKYHNDSRDDDNSLLMLRLIMHVVLISFKGTNIHYDDADYDKGTKTYVEMKPRGEEGFGIFRRKQIENDGTTNDPECRVG